MQWQGQEQVGTPPGPKTLVIIRAAPTSAASIYVAIRSLYDGGARAGWYPSWAIKHLCCYGTFHNCRSQDNSC